MYKSTYNERKTNKSNYLARCLIAVPFIYVFLFSFLVKDSSKKVVLFSTIGLIGIFIQNLPNKTYCEKKPLKIRTYNLSLIVFSFYILSLYIFRDGSQGFIRSFISVSILAVFIKSIRIEKEIFLYLILTSSILLLANLTYHYYYLGTIRKVGVMNIIPYATFCSAIAIIGFGNILQNIKKKNTDNFYISFFIFLFSTTAVILSMTRGVWLSQLLAMSALTVILFRKKSWKLIIYFILSILLIHFSSGIFSKRIEQTRIEVEKIRTGDLSGSIGLRLQMWKAAYLISKEKPLTGLGSSYQSRLEELYNNDKKIDESLQKFKVHHFHNQYIDIFVKYGLIGLTIYLYILTYPILFSLKNGIKNHISLVGVVLVYIFSGLTDVPVNYSQTIALYILLTTTLLETTFRSKNIRQ